MNEWLQKNLWAIIISVVTMVSTFTLYGYRIDALEKQQQDDHSSIQSLTTGQSQVQVQIAQIATDVSYTKASIDRLNTTLDKLIKY